MSSQIAIAHDYLTQRGGAERVVLSLLKAFPNATLYTTLYEPELTFPEFKTANIVTSKLNNFSLFRKDHRAAFPLLAPVASRLTVPAELTIVSSSGWAHGFNITGKSLIYCHAPARWLYQTENYLGAPAWRTPKGWLVSALKPGLKAWDAAAAKRADKYLANSTVVQQRIAETYQIAAELLPCPIPISQAGEVTPIPEIQDWQDFLLVVSRLLPYKNVPIAIEAVRNTDQKLLIIGSGPEAENLQATAPTNVHFAANLTDAQMRWAYQQAQALIAVSLEDFGLTPIEASAFGTPTVALEAGGYLDTISPGINGIFFPTATPAALKVAIHTAQQTSWDVAKMQQYITKFSEANFISKIQQHAAELLAK